MCFIDQDSDQIGKCDCVVLCAFENEDPESQDKSDSFHWSWTCFALRFNLDQSTPSFVSPTQRLSMVLRGSPKVFIPIISNERQDGSPMNHSENRQLHADSEQSERLEQHRESLTPNTIPHLLCMNAFRFSFSFYKINKKLISCAFFYSPQ